MVRFVKVAEFWQPHWIWRGQLVGKIVKINLRFEFLNPKDPKNYILNSSVGQTITKVRFEALLGGHFEFEALLSGQFEFEGDKK